MIAANARLAFDFDRAAAIIAALSTKPVSPMSLNPYRRKFVRGMSVKEFEKHASRRFKALAKSGGVTRQVISASQVIDDA